MVATTIGPRLVHAPQWRAALDNLFLDLDLAPVERPSIRTDVGPEEIRFAGLLEGVTEAAANAWTAILRWELQPSVAEALLIEALATQDPRGFTTALGPGLTYLKTTHVIRTRAAIGLHDYAREINWRRPILYVTALKAARSFLRQCVSDESLARPDLRKEFTGRLGVSTALIGRFEPTEIDDVNEAVVALVNSLEQGNDPVAALPYLVELLCRQYDLLGNAALVEAQGRLDRARRRERTLGLLLAGTEALLRNRDDLTDEQRRGALLVRSRALLTEGKALRNKDVEQRIRWLMLDAIVSGLEFDPRRQARLHGLSLPFAFRRPSEVSLVDLPLQTVGAALRPLALKGEPLARSLYADLIGIDERHSVADLRQLVRLRGATRRWAALDDERSRLLLQRDGLALAHLAGDRLERLRALQELVSMTARPSCAAASLVLIARDVERAGAVTLPPRKGWSSDQDAISRALYRGDARSLLQMAAERARHSPDLTLTSLGGRGGVVTVSDYFSVVGGTFVFKDTTVLSWRREVERSNLLVDALAARRLTDRFGVVEHLAPDLSDVADCDPREEVTTVRRFEAGRVLDVHAAEQSLSDRVELLGIAAEFLGFVHTVEDDTPVTGVRRQMRGGNDIGRWLNVIDPATAADRFERFWSLVEGMPLLRRRDAHPLNWLVSPEGRILAVDLEAIGRRPLGYELAQLTEDRHLLPHDDVVGRERILDRYLQAMGMESCEAFAVSYEASRFARAVRKLTPPDGHGAALQDGRAVLAHLGREGISPLVRELASDVLGSWNSSRGLGEDDYLTLGPSDAQRRRISRAMSYRLRHDRDIARDEDGWAMIDDLSAKISVNPVTIVLVATDFREPRFEVAGERVRALYGHSRPVVERRGSTGEESPLLFHATPSAAVELVLFAEGLRPMGRQFVHLSANPDIALAAGRRHGPPTLLAVDSAKVDDVRHVAGETYVASHVPKEAISVVPAAWLAHRRLAPPSDAVQSA
ncbi:hypothetical protein ASF47_17520 [Nocardioides sp. Leaf285]|nr:hypothetical protein ASF47_17520 [Nocardioides sp. Leaf285]